MGLRNKDLYKNECCFFVTTTCNNFKHLIGLSDSYQLIEESLAFVNDKFKADTLGYVIMPNHVHFIVYFRGSNELSSYMRDMKKFTSTRIRIKLEALGRNDIVEQIRNFEKGRSFQTWMDRYDDVYLQSKHLVETKLDYIHSNPLQAHWNLAKRPEEYRYFSVVYYEKGIQPQLKIVDFREYFG